MSIDSRCRPPRRSPDATTATGRRIAPVATPIATARRALPWARPYRWLLATFVVVTLSDGLVVTANPLVLRAILDQAVTRHHPPAVVRLAALVVALTVADVALTQSQRYLAARIGEGLVFDLRSALGRHLQRLSYGFFAQSKTGALVSRFVGDTTGLKQSFTDLSTVLANTALVVVSVAAMTSLSWQVTVAALTLVPLFLLPMRPVRRRLAAMSRQTMQVTAELSALLAERCGVGGALLAKLFGRPAEEAALIDHPAARLRTLGVKRTVYASATGGIMMLMSGVGTAIVYAGGGLLIGGGAASVGTVVALAALLARLNGPLRMLAGAQSSVAAAVVSFERIFEILDLEPGVPEAADAVDVPREPGRVEFDRVEFAYPAPGSESTESLTTLPAQPLTQSTARLPTQSTAQPPTGGEFLFTGRRVLSSVSFTIEPGQMVALVGPSGAGKTTISALLPRLYDVTAGAVRINGVDVRDATLASLRSVVGVITQEPHLFHDTVLANLRYAKPNASEAEMVSALELAQLGPLLERLPDGLGTVVGERGYRLSGGERQRLGIARIILRRPQVVVLDEATSHLDSECEAAVSAVLRTVLADRSSLVIAHRLATVRRADLLLVLEHGKIVERGTHEPLLAAGGRYADLFRTQYEPDGRDTPRSADAVSL